MEAQTYTTAEVMAALNLKDPETVHQMRRSGCLPAVPGLKPYRYAADTVRRVLAGEDLRRQPLPSLKKQSAPSAGKPAVFAGVKQFIRRSSPLPSRQ